MSQAGEGGRGGPPRRQATVLESVEEIRALFRTAGAAPAAGPGSRGGTVVERLPTTVAGAPEALAYRPTARPPMAILVALDDGEEEGELVRVRGASFTIGRVEGDLVIPHDSGMSGRHAEICRVAEAGGWTWLLRDLNSTNGTFARASSVTLLHGQEVLIGRRVFRFDAPAAPDPAAAPAGPAVTRKWDARSLGPDAAGPAPAPAALIDATQGGDGARHPLVGDEVRIGRDPAACAIAIDDPFVDPVHAVARRDPKGRWVLANHRSRNGLWARVREVHLGRGGAFQCGEQRFLFRVL